MPTALTFLGAAGTVTGSRHLVEHNGKKILLDVGLFQGLKALRQRNWDKLAVDPARLDAVVLSHAHIDHSGFLPRLHKDGFKGPVYCTSATKDLLKIMLPDSGRLAEEEAAYANKRKSSRHNPALPLYSEEDAERSLKLLQPVKYDTPTELLHGVTLTLTRAGHILGSATVHLDLKDKDGTTRRVTFSGDLGRYDMPIIPDPDPLPPTQYLLVECTYGDRSHKEIDPRVALREEIQRIIKNKGALIIPAFAVGRTQDLLFHIKQMQMKGELPALPIYVDSPMASDVTPLYANHADEHDEHMRRAVDNGDAPLRPANVTFVQGRDQSKAINAQKGPLIVIAGSGMATGGRVLHHLVQRLPDPNNTILFVGYQAEGTRGRRLLSGEPTLRMFGQDIAVRARVARIEGFSAHADFEEVDRWLATIGRPPRTTFCVHGEPVALEATRARLEARGWRAHVPAQGETVLLD